MSYLNVPRCHYKLWYSANYFVSFNVPSIGVAKKLLTGECSGDRETESHANIHLEKQLVGFWLRATPKTKNPVYISPGHRILPEEDLAVVKYSSHFRLPKPIRLAHCLVSQKKKELTKER